MWYCRPFICNFVSTVRVGRRNTADWRLENILSDVLLCLCLHRNQIYSAVYNMHTSDKKIILSYTYIPKHFHRKHLFICHEAMLNGKAIQGNKISITLDYHSTSTQKKLFGSIALNWLVSVCQSSEISITLDYHSASKKMFCLEVLLWIDWFMCVSPRKEFDPMSVIGKDLTQCQFQSAAEWDA